MRSGGWGRSRVTAHPMRGVEEPGCRGAGLLRAGRRDRRRRYFSYPSRGPIARAPHRASRSTVAPPVPPGRCPVRLGEGIPPRRWHCGPGRGSRRPRVHAGPLGQRRMDDHANRHGYAVVLIRGCDSSFQWVIGPAVRPCLRATASGHVARTTRRNLEPVAANRLGNTAELTAGPRSAPSVGAGRCDRVVGRAVDRGQSPSGGPGRGGRETMACPNSSTCSIYGATGRSAGLPVWGE